MGTVLLGQTTAGTTADFVLNGDPTGRKFTASASGTLATISCQLKVTNAGLTTAELGVYTDASTRPGTKLASATTSTGITGTGVFSVDVSASAVSISSGTVYWLAMRCVGEQVDFQGTSASSYLELATSIALPTTWNTSGNSAGTIGFVIWGEDNGGGGGGTTVKNLTALGVG